MVKDLVVLVGGNPLPNYIAARALQREDQITRVRLISTPQVQDVANLLGRALRNAGLSVTCPPAIGDAGDAAMIREIVGTALEGLEAPVHLHYTGGTNAMAVHAYEAWKEWMTNHGVFGCAEHASYLLGDGEKLRRDSGGEVRIEDEAFELDTLAQLHRLKFDPLKVTSAGDAMPTVEDARSVVGKVLCDFNIAKRLYPLFKECPEDGLKLIAKLGIVHGPRKQTIENDGSVKNEWVKFFLKTRWLEWWVAEMVTKALEHDGAAEIRTNLIRSGKPFEIDIVVRRGFRLYAISCTSNYKQSGGKAKMFEVAMRARQIGGDLARPAVVCLADVNATNGIRQDAETLSVAVRQPHIFGMADVRNWYDGDLYSLVQWLER